MDTETTEKNETEIRVCKNKKCGKALPDDYKHKYCEACRNKYAQVGRQFGKAVVAVAAGVVPFVIKSFVGDKTGSK